MKLKVLETTLIGSSIMVADACFVALTIAEATLEQGPVNIVYASLTVLLACFNTTNIK